MFKNDDLAYREHSEIRHGNEYEEEVEAIFTTDVEIAVDKIKMGKVPGFDAIVPQIIKYGENKFLYDLRYKYQRGMKNAFGFHPQ